MRAEANEANEATQSQEAGSVDAWKRGVDGVNGAFVDSEWPQVDGSGQHSARHYFLRQMGITNRHGQIISNLSRIGGGRISIPVWLQRGLRCKAAVKPLLPLVYMPQH